MKRVPTQVTTAAILVLFFASCSTVNESSNEQTSRFLFSETHASGNGIRIEILGTSATVIQRSENHTRPLRKFTFAEESFRELQEKLLRSNVAVWKDDYGSDKNTLYSYDVEWDFEIRGILLTKESHGKNSFPLSGATSTGSVPEARDYLSARKSIFEAFNIDR